MGWCGVAGWVWGGVGMGVGVGGGGAAFVDHLQQDAAPLSSVSSRTLPLPLSTPNQALCYLCRACPLERDSVDLSTHLSPCPSPTPPP